ncbi:MAG: hypothetical protein A3J28_11595 [Acidobacteria bacterium RIFCSPLOWO2_12_FULL_60_22]|nr:MAG: hypothetical protein A3J28_11595 [Acidobacteria bacterium RIFCSPLOWO2_12_FULL_60_22]
MQQVIPVTNLKQQQEALREEMDAAIRGVLERQDFILGREVAELEQAIAQRQDCSYGIGCASGSDALLLSLLALGVGPGDTVLVPAFTFFATAGSVARTGAQPSFVDIDPRTFNISPSAAEAVLKGQDAEGSLKAVIPVHLFGQCADMDAVLALAEQYKIFVVEDAAQAIGARYRSRAAGSMGVCGCFSFYPTKNLGACGDGGMITTDDPGLAERLRLLRNHGATEKHAHATLGINSRLDTLQAAILLVKLKRLEDWTAQRKQKAAFYRKALLATGLCDPAVIYPSRNCPVVLPYQSPAAEHVYHQFTLRVYRRDELASYLAAKGIETAIYYPAPLHLQPAFSYLGGGRGGYPQSERAAREVLSIPLYPEITEEQLSQVVQKVKNFYTV